MDVIDQLDFVSDFIVLVFIILSGMFIMLVISDITINKSIKEINKKLEDLKKEFEKVISSRE